MLKIRLITLCVNVCICLLIQSACNAQLNEDTGCPLNVNHVCESCAMDQNRLGCFCELADGTELITASVFTPCPAVEKDPCENHACENKANCTRDGLNNYKCICAVGYGGKLCNETLLKCDTNVTCVNSECVETTDPKLPIYCQCYDGTRRDPKQNDTCPPSPCYKENSNEPVCQNNATCRVINNGYLCECKQGFAGQNCSRLLLRPLCEEYPGVCGEGKCQQSLTRPFYSCNCGPHPGTFGKNITELVKCEQSGCYSTNPCQNGGTCSNKGVGAFVCQCPTRFTGAKCEKRSACYNNSCLNNGICQAWNETVYFCTCPPYFTGKRCETVIPNPCVGKNCGTYGKCEDVQGSAICRCSDGLHLDHSPCLDPCRNKSCNTGVCTKKPNATYEAMCSCPADRQGEECDLPRDLCRQSARCGGGYCKPKYGSALGFTCVCEGGVVKDQPCPFSKNCPIKDCGTEGVCVETDGIAIFPGAKPIYYVCSCKNGYITSRNCNELITIGLPKAKVPCGPKGEPYPSRNPNNPFGCWCKNGTHIPEIDITSTTELCV